MLFWRPDNGSASGLRRREAKGPKGRFDTGIKPLLGNLELLGQYHVTEQIGDYGRARQQSGIRRDVLNGASRPKE
jgi:hypothetical protein